MNVRLWFAALALVVMTGSVGRAAATDISGTWTASFDTQIGRQNYTYDFHGQGLDAHREGQVDNGETELTDGKVEAKAAR